MTPYSIETKYGNSESYRELLASAGIRGVSAVTFTPNLFVRNPHMDFYFGAFGHFATQAIGFARDLGADLLVLSPSAYAGRLFHYHPGLKDDAGDFIVRTLTLFTELAAKAKDEGVKLGLRPEYWSILPVNTVVDFCRQQDNVELVVNTAHIALSGSDPAAFLNTNIDITAYVQLSDTKLEDSNTFEKVVMASLEQGLVDDAVIGKDEKEQLNIWGIREDVAVLAEEKKFDQQFDISIPVAQIGEVIDKTIIELRNCQGVETIFPFGHVADGNIHFIIGKDSDDDDLKSKINEIIYSNTELVKGSISAEHGIGLDKKKYLIKSRSKDEIELMRLIKKSIDPKNILNPGRVF